MNIDLISYESKNYPGYLLEIPDPPIVLYVKGRLIEDDKNALSIVGTRTPTAKGLQNSYHLAKKLCLYGITIVSGMAKGIDTAAHRGALENNGRTIAILGCGIDRIYPQENVELYHKIAEHGAVISEFPFGTPPNKWNFPIRNRIIAGLSIGIAMVEGRKDSGALITANLGIDFGREVYAFPGPADSPNYEGGHTLIQKGAKLIVSFKDLIDDLRYVLDIQLNNDNLEDLILADEDLVKLNLENYDNSPTSKSEEVKKNLINEEKIIFELLDRKIPKHIDQIVDDSNLMVKDVLKSLISLEMKDLCKMVYTNHYIKLL